MRIYLITILFIFFSCFQKKEISQIKLNYLALGDSYTIGESVDYNHNYPIQLKNQINNNYNIKIDSVFLVARTGWTTGDLIDSLSKLNLSTHEMDDN